MVLPTNFPASLLLGNSLGIAELRVEVVQVFAKFLSVSLICIVFPEVCKDCHQPKKKLKKKTHLYQLYFSLSKLKG